MKSKVCFVMPYFGKLPESFLYWLECCRNNPEFDWLILTDDKNDFPYPPNVKVEYTTLTELKKRIEARMECQVALEKPYKLCDYKPLYGWLLEEELKDYTHWGYGDMDLLFGKLSNFITDEILEHYAKVSMLGHLSIMKNTARVNCAFQQCNWKSIFQTPRICVFDEVRVEPNINAILENMGLNVLSTLPYADIDSTHYNFHQWEYKRGNRTTKCRYVPNLYHYVEGKLFKIELKDHSLVEEEIAYVHFQKRRVSFPETVMQRYLLVPNKIIADRYLSEKDMHSYCCDDLKYTMQKTSEWIWNGVKKRLI